MLVLCDLGLRLVEIPTNPYQGLKLKYSDYPRHEYVEIPTNPYQGLKQEANQKRTGLLC